MKITTPFILALATTLYCHLSAADNIAVFPPGTDSKTVAGFAQRLEKATGISTRGVISLPPESMAKNETAALDENAWFKQAKKAYKQLEFAAAKNALEQIEESCCRESLLDECRPLLFDMHIMRGAIFLAAKEPAKAAHAFRSARHVLPSGVINPRHYAPNVAREFGKVSTTINDLPTLKIDLVAKPNFSQFKIDGMKSAAGSVELSPGRHIIEAISLGYRSQIKIIDVDENGDGPPFVKFKLKKIDESVGWNQLRRILHAGVGAFSSPGVVPLFKRFGIDVVFMVEKSASEYKVFISYPGESNRTALPSIQSESDIPSPEFQQPLLEILGIAPRESEYPPDPEKENDETDEGEESTFIVESSTKSPPVDGNPNTEVSNGKKIIKSPWFWASIGIAVSIVTGVVITMKVSD